MRYYNRGKKNRPGIKNNKKNNHIQNNMKKKNNNKDKNKGTIYGTPLKVTVKKNMISTISIILIKTTTQNI